ncbi:gamma-glutamylcyclotransferase family protein [Actinoallomurus soli]|uniref:gamma-glutamylcyclotransferase family protein n=1 Tax=Actinoallomurus soli TaxID=2952535 RepID=UPI00209340AC|nr:gamma-glutamylcyclotransferase family protein [Actinoallomurus soli]MCO5971271.1 gamma-glutamylcyclotransferase [Actinoallomurus soli]
MRDPAWSPAPGPAGPGRRAVGEDGLFVYGTLQFPELLAALLGRVPERRPAGARGWRAAVLPGRAYPGLVPGEATVHGFLLTGLTMEEWRALDTFEGPAYERTRITLIDGRAAWSYVWIATAEAGAGEWSPQEFAARHLPAYVQRCAAWRRSSADHAEP